MKKLMFILVLLLCSVFIIHARQGESLSAEIRTCIDEFSQGYADRFPGLGSKRGAAILEFNENGDEVKRNKLGVLIETYIEEQMENSIVFYLVDRENLDEILKEQSFSLSGLVDEDTGPEIGDISGVAVFLSGEIIKEGPDFKVSIKLTDASTTEVLDTYSFYIPERQMIDASLDLQYSYVAPNGIGFSFGMNYLIIPPPGFNQETILKTVWDLSAKYRISKDFMVEMGVLMPFVSKTDSYYVYPEQFTYGDIQPQLAGSPAAETADLKAAVQSIWISHVDLQYTINFSPEFNIGVKLGWVFCPDTIVRISTNPYYKLESWDSAGTALADAIVQEAGGIDLVFGHMHGGRVEIAPEFFITPRIAINAVAGYILTLPVSVWEVRIGTKHFESADYFGYDPTLMPDGTPWSFDLTSFYGGLSVSVFF